ncbi:MAG: RNA polymerase sigma factor [Limisphaerales bacterium]
MGPSHATSQHTRATLIRRLKNWQDQGSWQEFYDTYWRLIYGVSRKSGLTDAEAQDVVQETMLAVAKHMPTFTYDPKLGSFKAWLLNMTRWRIQDQFRKRRTVDVTTRRTEDSDPGQTSFINRVPDPDSQHIDAVWELEWEQNLLAAALDRVKCHVDPLKYQIFDLYVNQGWMPEKVARSCGISVDEVYLAKHRITQSIKSEVERLEREIR